MTARAATRCWVRYVSFQKNDDKAADKFFLDVRDPPPRFRPAQTGGGVLAEHPQNGAGQSTVGASRSAP